MGVGIWELGGKGSLGERDRERERVAGIELRRLARFHGLSSPFSPSIVDLLAMREGAGKGAFSPQKTHDG